MEIFDPTDQSEQARCVRGVRWMIWAYFLLLFGEGILRKWLVPQFSAPLAIVRDPFLLMAMLLALRAQIFPWNTWTISLSAMGLASLGVGLIPEANTLSVALNGFRTNFLHFYLVFLMPRVITPRDVEKMTKIAVWLLPLVAALMVVQFYSPPTAFINATTGLGGKQLAGTVGNIRPPSIFPFITGVAEYTAMVTAFLLAGVLKSLPISITALGIGFASLVVACGISISRFTIFGVALAVMAYVVYALLRPRLTSQLLTFSFFGAAMVAVLLQMGFLQKSLDVFSERVELASDYEKDKGGMLARITDNFTHPLNLWADASWCGEGLGILTNAGALLVKGNLANLQIENELSRVMVESGLFMGAAFVLWRMALFGFLFYQSLRVAQWGFPLPWLLLPIAGQLILIGQLGRPTTLGFTAFTAGLCLTAIEHAYAQRAKEESESV